MNPYPQESIESFVRTLSDRQVCFVFNREGIPRCVLHQVKRGVFVQTKSRGGLFFVVDPVKGEYFFKLFDHKRSKVRWSCKIPKFSELKLSDEKLIIGESHAVSFLDPGFKERSFLKHVGDVFREDFSMDAVTLHRKTLSSPKGEKTRRKKTDKSKSKKKKKKREPFTPGEDVESEKKKKKKKKEITEECVALFDYKAKSPLELSVKEGDVLKIHGINPEEGYIVGEIINPSDMAVSSKSKRRAGKGVKSKKQKTPILGQVPEHYTNHLLEEYKEKLEAKDDLEIAIKKWEKYRAMEEERLRKREEAIEIREMNIDQDRVDSMRDVQALKSKILQEQKEVEEKRKKEHETRRRELEKMIRLKKEDIVKTERMKKKDIAMREKVLKKCEDRSVRQGQRLTEQEDQLKVLSIRIKRKSKRLKTREKHMTEREQIIDVQERRFKERNYNLKKFEVKLIAKGKELEKKERDLRRQEGIINKKRFALKLPSEALLEEELEKEKNKGGKEESEQEGTNKKKKKKKVDDTVFHDLLKKQQEVDQLTSEMKELRNQIQEANSKTEDLKSQFDEKEKDYQKEIKRLEDELTSKNEEKEGEEEEEEPEKLPEGENNQEELINKLKKETSTLKKKVKSVEEEKQDLEATYKESMEDLMMKQDEKVQEYERKLKEKGEYQASESEEINKLRSQVTSLLKLKEGEQSNEIRRLKVQVKKLKSQNKKFQKKVSMLEEIRHVQGEKIRENKKMMMMKRSSEKVVHVHKGALGTEEIGRMKVELDRVVGSVKRSIASEQLWYQVNQLKFAKQTKERLSMIEERARKRTQEVYKKKEELMMKEGELKDLELELGFREKKIQEKEVQSIVGDELEADPDLVRRARELEVERISQEREKRRLEKKKVILTEWEAELKSREDDVTRRETELHEQRVKFLEERNKKRSPGLPRPKILQGEEMDEFEEHERGTSSPNSPRIDEVKKMTQESPGRLQGKSRDDSVAVRPRRMSRESPGRLESPKSSPGNDQVSVPDHLKPSFGKKCGKFDFIVGRYEHRIKFAKKELKKTLDFEEQKGRRVLSADLPSLRSIMGRKGKKGKNDEPSPLPSPLSAKVKLKKLVDTKPPVPSKTRRLKTDELADIIFSPKMRKEQLKLFDDYTGEVEGEEDENEDNN